MYGIGINDADYIVFAQINGTRVMCPYYRAWKCMIVRCYNQKFQNRYHTYKECSTTKDWLIFSNFKDWMKTQDWQGKELDKDILTVGNKEYSPEACVFVSGDINKLLGDNAESRGEYPQGVCWHKRAGKFMAQCSVSGDTKYLGCFNTITEAEIEYLEFKVGLIKKVAGEEEANGNQNLKAGLLRHADIFKIKINEHKKRIARSC